MTNLVTPEKLYSIWYTHLNRQRGIAFSKQIKNFDKIRERPYWKDFERCAQFINRNNGQVDAELYVESLFNFFNGNVKTDILATLKSIQIYKAFLNSREKLNDEDFIKSEILRSLNFILAYCKKHKLNDIYEYFIEDLNLIPTMFRHLNGKSISLYFLACFDNIELIVCNFPPDVIHDYYPNFFNDFKLYRSRVINKISLNKLRINLEKIIKNNLETSLKPTN